MVGKKPKQEVQIEATTPAETPVPDKIPQKIPEPKKPVDLFDAPTIVEETKPVDNFFVAETKPEVIPTKVEEKPKFEPPKTNDNPMSVWNVGNSFNLDEEEVNGKEIYTIYGLKGQGKTSLAFSFPGTIACLSFDHKSAMIKSTMYNNDSRIKVFNAIKFQNDSTPGQTLESAEITFKYVTYLLKELAKIQPDWIVVDGIEVLQQIAEMVMRSRNNLMPYQGIANPNIWKERRLYIRQVHRMAVEACKKGVIYTTYTDKDELIENGTLLTKKNVPKWVDAIMMETDDVIHIEASSDKSGGRKFTATVESSKTGLPTGKVFDVTDAGISVIWKEKKVKQ